MFEYLAFSDTARYCLLVPNQEYWWTNGKVFVALWISLAQLHKISHNGLTLIVFPRNIILILEVRLLCVKCLLLLP